MGEEKMTIAVDFDGVIHSYTSGWKDDWIADPIELLDPPVEGAIMWLVDMAGSFDVVIYTTRAANNRRAKHAIRKWLLHWYFRDGGSDCSSYVVDVLSHIKVTDRKPPALVYIDDRAIRFEGPGTFPTKDDINQAVPWNKKRSVMRNYIDIVGKTNDGKIEVAVRSESERDVHGVIEDPYAHIMTIATQMGYELTIKDTSSNPPPDGSPTDTRDGGDIRLGIDRHKDTVE